VEITLWLQIVAQSTWQLGDLEINYRRIPAQLH